MHLLPRLFVDDEELGKKDDDHRPDRPSAARARSRSPAPVSTLLGRRVTAPRFRRRRIFGVLGLIVFIYFFFKHVPTGLTPASMRIDSRVPGRTINGHPSFSLGAGKLNGLNGLDADEIAILRGGKKTAEHHYAGPLRFYGLPTSLHSITHTAGYRDANKNVLFLAGNLQSASRLIAMACEMAQYNRNYVHFAYIGREGVDIAELQELNGVKDGCSVYWHDGSPDRAGESTETRMEYGVTSAMHHIQQYMHPQVHIMDDPDHEEPYLVKGLRSHAARLGKPLVELPSDAVRRMMWITRLDHTSLAAWSTTYIDILIQVPPRSASSLIRLLRSIASADYFGGRKPHLTIELPPEVEPAIQSFLESFVWPPLDHKGTPHTSQITLRHRVSTQHLTPLEASARTVESFFSHRPLQSHVVLLSTQTELSQLWYHYLFYHTLEYGYSYYSRGTYQSANLMGIALNLPSHLLDGETPLTPPPLSTASSDTANLPFLWQGPDTNAALYFGKKWEELHSFLGLRMENPTERPQARIISRAFPAFAEPLLELMRLRGYFMLYPNLPEGESIVTVHNDLAALPEEFQRLPEALSPDSGHDEARQPPSTQDMLYMTEPDAGPASLPPEHNEAPLLSITLTAILPNDGDLPELSTLTIWDHSGLPITAQEAHDEARDYSSTFRKNIGRCENSYNPPVHAGSALDLFCVRKQGQSQSNTIKFAEAEPETRGREVGQVEIEHDTEAIRLKMREEVREKRKNSAANQYPEGWIDGEPGPELVSKQQRKEMQDEFWQHLERQGEKGHKSAHHSEDGV